MIQSLLKESGLDQKEAQIYESIVEKGKQTVPSLLVSTPVKRGDLYNVLERLQERNLIHLAPNEKKRTYTAINPEAIEQTIKTKERKLKEAKDQLSQLYSMYNLGVGKPGVRFDQGIDGIKDIFADTLTAKTEILAYADIDGWMKHLKKYAVWYARERRTKKIKERAIVPNTPEAKKYIGGYDMEVTQVKFIPHEKFKFKMEMNIYDNKVTYVTFREPFISVMIEDQAVADTHRAIFELSWLNAESEASVGKDL